jgi:hypothetical protein
MKQWIVRRKPSRLSVISVDPNDLRMQCPEPEAEDMMTSVEETYQALRSLFDRGAARRCQALLRAVSAIYFHWARVTGGERAL